LPRNHPSIRVTNGCLKLGAIGMAQPGWGLNSSFMVTLSSADDSDCIGRPASTVCARSNRCREVAILRKIRNDTVILSVAKDLVHATRSFATLRMTGLFYDCMGLTNVAWKEPVFSRLQAPVIAERRATLHEALRVDASTRTSTTLCRCHCHFWRPCRCWENFSTTRVWRRRRVPFAPSVHMKAR
jgi:hypothetical protein